MIYEGSVWVLGRKVDVETETVFRILSFFPGPGLQTARWTGCKLTFRETELKRLLQARKKPEEGTRGNEKENDAERLVEQAGAIFELCVHHFFLHDGQSCIIPTF